MSLEEKAFELVSKAILRNEFSDGLLPSEHKLAERFGVSRTPLRASLRRLERDGLIRRKSARGYELVSIDARAIREIFEVREAIECYAALVEPAEINIGRLRVLNRIFQFYAQMERSEMYNFDVDCLREADAQLHHAIIQSLDNNIATEILNRAEMRLAGIQLMAWAARERTMESVHEHLNIIEAIFKGDAASAAKLLRDHISYGRATMLTKLGQRRQATSYLLISKDFVKELLDEGCSDSVIDARIRKEREMNTNTAETDFQTD